MRDDSVCMRRAVYLLLESDKIFPQITTLKVSLIMLSPAQPKLQRVHPLQLFP